MATIQFFYEETPFLLSTLQKRSLRNWIKKLLKVEAPTTTLIQLNYIFCSDDYLLQINQTYLQHDYYTDIITFNNSDDKKSLEGDLFISIDRIQENAVSLKASFELEFLRVMVHGVLHLLGYKDKTPLQQAQMREKENQHIQQYPHLPLFT